MVGRFGLGSILGAGAAGAYGAQQFSQNGLSGVWGMLPSAWGNGAPGGVPGASADVQALQNELRRLTGMMGDMARSQNKPTVVHVGGSGRSSWTVLIVPTALGGVALYLYCRITGSSFWDLLYVSRSSLTAFRTTVQESMAKVWDELRRQKEELCRAMGGLVSKQDALAESQEQLMDKQLQMDATLRKVDDTCGQLEMKANTTINQVQALDGQVKQMDNRLQDVHMGVQAANTGIYMLVSAVSEVTQKIGLHNSKTAKALKAYAETGGPVWGGGSSNGSGARQAISHSANAALEGPSTAAPPPVPALAPAISFPGASGSQRVLAEGGSMTMKASGYQGSVTIQEEPEEASPQQPLAQPPKKSTDLGLHNLLSGFSRQ